jgi:hypothetical protein
VPDLKGRDFISIAHDPQTQAANKIGGRIESTETDSWFHVRVQRWYEFVGNQWIRASTTKGVKFGLSQPLCRLEPDGRILFFEDDPETADESTATDIISAPGQPSVFPA